MVLITNTYTKGIFLLYFYSLFCSDEQTNTDGIWYDGKTRRLWGHIEDTTLEWWDGVKSKILLEKPNYIQVPLQKDILKGRIAEKGLIEWADGAVWRLGSFIGIDIEISHQNCLLW